MKYILYVIIGIAVAVSCSDSDEHTRRHEAKDVLYDTVSIMVMQIQKCSRLYTAEYGVRKIITHEDDVSIKGNVLNTDVNIKLPLGDRKIAIPVTARLKAYIDFAQFSEKNIERHGDKLTIVLPDPKVILTSSKVDQQGIRQYVAITRSNFTDKEMADYEYQGRKSILESIPQLGIIEMAKANAARVLVPMLVQMGYKDEDITIVFRKEYTIGDLKRILEKGTAL